MIIYIHGFASSGRGEKAKIVLNYFKENVIAPSFSYKPFLAIDTLEQIVESFLRYKIPIAFIGSSLGGYYSIYLSQKYNLPAVLINPSIEPYITLSTYRGMVENYFDHSKFEWCKSDIEELKRVKPKEIYNPNNFFLLLQKGDELLDYKVAASLFSKSPKIVEEGGSHSFDNFHTKLKDIDDFLRMRGALER